MLKLVHFRMSDKTWRKNYFYFRQKRQGKHKQYCSTAFHKPPMEQLTKLLLKTLRVLGCVYILIHSILKKIIIVRKYMAYFCSIPDNNRKFSSDFIYKKYS